MRAHIGHLRKRKCCWVWRGSSGLAPSACWLCSKRCARKAAQIQAVAHPVTWPSTSSELPEQG